MKMIKKVNCTSQFKSWSLSRTYSWSGSLFSRSLSHSYSWISLSWSLSWSKSWSGLRNLDIGNIEN